MVGFGYRAVPAAPFPYDSEVSLHTCVLLALALQQGPAGAPAGTAAGGETTNIVSLVARAPVTSKAVLLILALFSAISWGVILYKMWQFQRASRQSASFLDIFRRSSKFSEVQAVCRTLAESPLVGIFQAGYAELTAQLKANPSSATGSNPGRPGETQARPTLKSLDALDRALLRASGVEVTRLEKRVTFLATTASITPFIGLFGTVWGIMSSFQQIGATGSTNLAVVAPGIADALIATAAGLFAAIPAVYFYNQFTQQVKGFVMTMEDFSLEFITIAERNFT
jgi:biopolymer transport protein TolQ